MCSWRNGKCGNQADAGNPFKAVRELPQCEFKSGVFDHRARVDFLFSIGERERIDVKLGRKADENGNQAEVAPRS